MGGTGFTPRNVSPWQLTHGLGWLLVVVVARQRPGMAGMVDTFVAPALLVMMLAEDDEKTFARMQTVVQTRANL